MVFNIIHNCTTTCRIRFHCHRPNGSLSFSHSIIFLAIHCPLNCQSISKNIFLLPNYFLLSSIFLCLVWVFQPLLLLVTVLKYSRTIKIAAIQLKASRSCLLASACISLPTLGAHPWPCYLWSIQTLTILLNAFKQNRHHIDFWKQSHIQSLGSCPSRICLERLCHTKMENAPVALPTTPRRAKKTNFNIITSNI